MTPIQKIIKYFAIALAIFIIVNIISAIVFGIYTFANILGINNTNKIETIEGDKVITTFEDSQISTLKIDLKYTNLIIKSGETLKIESNNKDISCKKDKNKLEIEEKNHNWLSKKEKNELIIYLPDNISLDTAKIEAGAGTIKADKLTVKEFTLEMGAGIVEIENLNVTKEANIEGGAGTVEIISGNMNNLNLDMGIGKAIITTKLTGNNKINAGIGKLEINLTDNKDNYSIRANKGIGSITIDGKEVSNEVEYGSGESKIKIDGGIGNVQINYLATNI